MTLPGFPNAHLRQLAAEPPGLGGRDHSSRHALVVTSSPSPRISIIAFFTFITVGSDSIILTVADTCNRVTDIQLLRAVAIAITSFTTIGGCCITITTSFAKLTELSGGPVLAAVADVDTLRASRVVVAAAVEGAVNAVPAEVAVASVLGGPQAVTVHALVVTRFDTTLFPIADEPSLALTAVRTVRVGALGILVTVVESLLAFIDVRTLVVRPCGVFWIQACIVSLIYLIGTTFNFSNTEISRGTNTHNRIIKIVTPSAAKRL